MKKMSLKFEAFRNPGTGNWLIDIYSGSKWVGQLPTSLSRGGYKTKTEAEALVKKMTSGSAKPKRT
jgi:hypothetical protein